LRMEDMIMISVDDHLVEPPDVFKDVPAALREKMPKFVALADGTDVWQVGDLMVPNVACNAVVGRPKEEYGMEPTSHSQLRRGTYDVEARLDDMNVNGQLAGLNFPSFPGVFGAVFSKLDDKDVALATIQAYNDWHIDQWCGAHPGRFIPCALVPLWDGELAATEVRRVKEKGCNAISFPPNPSQIGMATLHDPAWNPMWAACDELSVTVSMHISDPSGCAPSLDTTVDSFFTNMPVSLYANASDLVFSPVLRTFANLKICLAEGGAGWVPYFLERMDFVHRHHKWTRQDFGGKTPSQVFNEHCYVCFIDDKTAIRNREVLDMSRVCWECDYPHSDSVWPESPEILWEGLQGVSDQEIDQITHLNAMEAFNFDPFKHLPREQCTVGALRELGKDVDIRLIPRGGVKPSLLDEGPVRMRDVAQQIAATCQVRVPEAAG